MEELFHKQIEEHYNYVKNNKSIDSSPRAIYQFAKFLYRSVYSELDSSILKQYRG